MFIYSPLSKEVSSISIQKSFFFGSLPLVGVLWDAKKLFEIHFINKQETGHKFLNLNARLNNDLNIMKIFSFRSYLLVTSFGLTQNRILQITPSEYDYHKVLNIPPLAIQLFLIGITYKHPPQNTEACIHLYLLVVIHIID